MTLIDDYLSLSFPLKQQPVSPSSPFPISVRRTGKYLDNITFIPLFQPYAQGVVDVFVCRLGERAWCNGGEGEGGGTGGKHSAQTLITDIRITIPTTPTTITITDYPLYSTLDHYLLC